MSNECVVNKARGQIQSIDLEEEKLLRTDVGQRDEKDKKQE